MARAGFDVLLVLQALREQHRVAEANHRPHHQPGGLARIDQLELARLDAVAHDLFRDHADSNLL